MAHMPLSLISRLIPAIDDPPRQRTVIGSLNRCLGCAEDLPGLRRWAVHSSIPLGLSLWEPYSGVSAGSGLSSQNNERFELFEGWQKTYRNVAGATGGKREVIE